MKLRIGIVIAAVISALAGVAIIAAYIGGLENKAERGRDLVKVYVVVKNAHRGLPADELESAGLIKLTRVPRKYVSEGALSSLRGLENRFLIASLAPGTQLTKSLFITPRSGLSTPRSKVAVAVPISQTALINGRIKDGDRVIVLATVKEGDSGKPITTTVLKRALVLSVEMKTDGGGMGSGGGGGGSVTLAINPQDSEKLVFAATEGEVWVALWPPAAGSMPKQENPSGNTQPGRD